MTLFSSLKIMSSTESCSYEIGGNTDPYLNQLCDIDMRHFCGSDAFCASKKQKQPTLNLSRPRSLVRFFFRHADFEVSWTSKEWSSYTWEDTLG